MKNKPLYPWNVTAAEALTFETYIAFGTARAAAARLNKSVSTIDNQLTGIHAKMRLAGVLSHRTGKLQWVHHAHEAWRRYWQNEWEREQRSRLGG